VCVYACACVSECVRVRALVHNVKDWNQLNS